jgi:mannose-6-phosphate isomerase-like protein (cupin superfamily)
MEEVPMIVRGRELEVSERGLKLYPLTSKEVAGNHFGVWITRPETPFVPHKHQQREIWFILEGQAVLNLGGETHIVGPGDLIELAPWVEHGLSTETQVRWICMG